MPHRQQPHDRTHRSRNSQLGQTTSPAPLTATPLSPMRRSPMLSPGGTGWHSCRTSPPAPCHVPSTSGMGSKKRRVVCNGLGLQLHNTSVPLPPRALKDALHVRCIKRGKLEELMRRLKDAGKHASDIEQMGDLQLVQMGTATHREGLISRDSRRERAALAFPTSQMGNPILKLNGLHPR